MRNNKRVIGMVLALVCSFGLSSCAGDLGYTEEQEDIIANYAAEIVLKHDVEYKYNYMDSVSNKIIEEETIPVIEEEVTTENQPIVTPDNIIDTEDTENQSISDSSQITSAFELPDGVKAEYVDYMITEIYPIGDSEDIFVMKSVANSKLLVVKFRITNTTQSDVSVNFMANEKKYKGIVDDSKKYNAQLTLLSDALNTYEGNISANSYKELVLIYQTQVDKKEDIGSLAVSISNNLGEENKIYLKK